MHGFPLEISKTLIRELVSRLRPTDRFNVLLFAGSSQLLSEQSLSANPVNIRKAIDLIDRQRGGGGTELVPALQRALDLPHEENISRTIVIATDGYVDVEKKAFEIIRGNLGKANVFAFGIGTSVNRFLIEGIARAGLGEPFIVTRPEEAVRAATKFREYIETPVLRTSRCSSMGSTSTMWTAEHPRRLRAAPRRPFREMEGKSRGDDHDPRDPGRQAIRAKDRCRVVPPSPVEFGAQVPLGAQPDPDVER